MTHRHHLGSAYPLTLVALIAGAMLFTGCDQASGTDAGTGGGSGGGAGGGGGSRDSGVIDAGTPACDHSVPTSLTGFTTISFDATGTTVSGFGGADDSQIVGDPACGVNSANKVLQVGRSPTAFPYAGTTVATLTGGKVTTVALTSANSKMSMRTRSSAVGIHVRLKLEDAAAGSHSVETEATTTVAGAWETLTFDFANQAATTPALNPAYTYNKLTVFFDFGTAGSAGNSRVYYADDIAFIGGGTTTTTDAGMTADAGGMTFDAGGMTFDAGSVVDAGSAVTFPVFVGNFNSAVDAGFVPFTNSINDITIDATTTNAGGHPSMKVVGPSSMFTGGALVASTPSDLSSYNVLTFWAKASVALTITNMGFGDTADNFSGPKIAEFHATSIGTGWAKYTFPIPNPAAATGMAGLFFFAGGIGSGQTVWFNDVQFEHLDAAAYNAAVGVVTNVYVNWPGAPQVPAGSGFTLDFAPNTVFFTTPTVYRVGWNYFSLKSSNTAIATVNADGVVTGVDAGTAIISADPLGGYTVPGSTTFTVTAPISTATPTTAAPAPTHPAANVIWLYNSSGTYTAGNSTQSAVDPWSTTWSVYGATGGYSTYAIPSTTSTVHKYSVLQFAGVDFAKVDATAAGMTHFHCDVWTANAASQFGVKMGVGGGFQVTHAAPLTTTGDWVGVDFDLSTLSGVDLANFTELLFVDNITSSENGTFFIDNVYFWK